MGKFAIALIVALLIQPGSGATAPLQLADSGPTLYQRLGDDVHAEFQELPPVEAKNIGRIRAWKLGPRPPSPGR